ncbi:rhodopsin, GQ-coupled [Elysia marginata]|uniref:Rhodopsin, GQ-coupled n=1 Tax=Elysia marginata TaxID=1093978 RepID=A0AAV4JD28_9GAST|nr:rhodopsin, GQ-coupled [Elysia marginata]
MSTVTKDEIFGSGLFAILGLSLVSNLVFLIVVWNRRRLHTAHHALLTALACSDILIGGAWTGLSAGALLTGWDLAGAVCRLHSFLLTLTQTLSAFLLATLGVERAFRMITPSHHNLVFGFSSGRKFTGGKKTVAFLIAAEVVFCGVVSSIHLYGTLPVVWLSDQRSCGARFTESLKMLDLTFCFDYAIPYWVVALPAFVVAFVKFNRARKKSPPQGEIVLQKNSYAPGDAYSSRLSKMQHKFRSNKPALQSKPRKLGTLGKRVYTPKGYTELEDWDSDIQTENNSFDSNDGRQRVHLLPRPEYSALMTSAITVLITSLFWFPWIVARFIWHRTPRDPPPDWLGVLAVLLMHSAALIKLATYIISNPYFRSAAWKTFCCRKKTSSLSPAFSEA